ncbi:MAG: hypothetical protein GY863_15330 [bacterium]|nr:hypothetical protein [bacterium]
MKKLKKTLLSITLIIALSAIGILWINSDILAQVNLTQTDIQKQLRKENVEIPFVDRDGDGINDLLQNGWGLRFLRQYKNRREAWNQIMENGENAGKMIDTDGDGIADTPMQGKFRGHMNELIDTDGDGVADTAFRDYMKTLMHGLIDTNGDGVADTPIGEYMRRQFQLLDQDGDGIPDELTGEQIRENMKQMREWRRQIRENLKNGLPAFTDENGDGIPDNLPAGFGWIGRHKKGKGIGGL